MAKPNRKSHGPSSVPSEFVEETFQHADFLSDLLAIENEARRLGSSELVRWAEQLKDAKLHVICGEPVPHEVLGELFHFVREHTGADRTAAEVLS